MDEGHLLRLQEAEVVLLAFDVGKLTREACYDYPSVAIGLPSSSLSCVDVTIAISIGVTQLVTARSLQGHLNRHTQVVGNAGGIVLTQKTWMVGRYIILGNHAIPNLGYLLRLGGPHASSYWLCTYRYAVAIRDTSADSGNTIIDVFRTQVGLRPGFLGHYILEVHEDIAELALTPVVQVNPEVN